MSARECRLCGLTAGDLPDGVGFENEYVLADFFDGGLCEGCRAEPFERDTYDDDRKFEKEGL